MSVSVLFISACVRVGPQYRSPDTGLSPPPAYQHVPPEAYPVPEDWWWEVFGDPEIDRLVQDVLKENWDVKQAAARVLEMTSFVGLQMGGGFHRGKIQVGEHLAQVIVQLVEGEKRPGISARRLAALWRKKVGTIPDVEALTFQSELFSLGKAIEINLYHEDHRVLIAAAERLKDALRGQGSTTSPTASSPARRR